MPDVTIKIEGLDQLQRTLETLPRNVARKVLRTSLREAADELRERISSSAPRESGFLASHFDVRLRVKSNELAASAYVGPESKVYYPDVGDRRVGTRTGKHPQKGGVLPVVSVARFVEYGTSKMPARPFMRPAFESVKDTMLNMIIQGIKDALAEFGGTS